MARGKTIVVRNLPVSTKMLFSRAIDLAGVGSQAQWVSAQIRRFIREQQERFGEDLFAVLTADEQQVLDAIRNGAATPDQIAEETLLTDGQVAKILAHLEQRGRIEARRQGKATSGQRGARQLLYFAIEVASARR
jgi:predicted Rossmann fold nucleotide-binding protein DprA/Smf involved in DNA uptake